jgi:glycosyltransferase involved in cell wall biosynthesis
MLRRAVASILGQDYPGEIECVVVFDRTEIALPDLEVPAGRTLRAVPNERTPGLAGARNSGIVASTGSLVAHCDDDDEWLPEKIRLEVDALAARPDASMVGTGMFVHYDDKVFPRVPERSEITFRMLLRSRVADVHTSSFLIRKADLDGRIGLVDEQLPGSHAEDYEFLLRAARHGPIVVVRRPLVRAYWHPVSFFAQSWSTHAAALEELIRRFPEFRTDRVGYARISGQIGFLLAGAGERRRSMEWVRRALRADWRERRSYIAMAVASGLVSPGFVLRVAHRAGKGI